MSVGRLAGCRAGWLVGDSAAHMLVKVPVGSLVAFAGLGLEDVGPRLYISSLAPRGGG